MDKSNLEGTYIIGGVNYVKTPLLSAKQQSRVRVVLGKDEELDYYGRLGSLLLSMYPYQNLQGIIPPQPIEFEVSDQELREEIEARAFSLTECQLKNYSFSPRSLEERLKGTFVNIIVDKEGDITSHLTYLRE